MEVGQRVSTRRRQHQEALLDQVGPGHDQDSSLPNRRQACGRAHGCTGGQWKAQAARPPGRQAARPPGRQAARPPGRQAGKRSPRAPTAESSYELDLEDKADKVLEDRPALRLRWLVHASSPTRTRTEVSL